MALRADRRQLKGKYFCLRWISGDLHSGNKPDRVFTVSSVWLQIFLRGCAAINNTRAWQRSVTLCFYFITGDKYQLHETTSGPGRQQWNTSHNVRWPDSPRSLTTEETISECRCIRLVRDLRWTFCWTVNYSIRGQSTTHSAPWSG